MAIGKREKPLFLIIQKQIDERFKAREREHDKKRIEQMKIETGSKMRQVGLQRLHSIQDNNMQL